MFRMTRKPPSVVLAVSPPTEALANAVVYSAPSWISKVKPTFAAIL